MVFAQEKVVVVELHRVDPVLRLQVGEDGRGAGRRLHLLAVVYRNDAAEIAAERTSDTGLMDRGARAKKCACDVLRGIETMIRRPGKIVRRLQRALGGVDVQAERVF